MYPHLPAPPHALAMSLALAVVVPAMSVVTPHTVAVRIASPELHELSTRTVSAPLSLPDTTIDATSESPSILNAHAVGCCEKLATVNGVTRGPPTVVVHSFVEPTRVTVHV